VGLLAHRDSALVLAGNRPLGSSVPDLERQLAILTEAGFRPEDAVLALLSLSAYAIGEALDTQRETGRDAAPSGESAPGGNPDPAELSAYPLLGAAIDALEPFGSSDQRFEYGLNLLITGLRAQHASRRETPQGGTPHGITLR
jgi:TetR/AcrR family transcriptional regulator, tetracycline repressor protein